MWKEKKRKKRISFIAGNNVSASALFVTLCDNITDYKTYLNILVENESLRYKLNNSTD